MKYIYLFSLLTVFTFFGCEEVVTVDLPTASPRLVVEGSINWQKGTSGNIQTIKLSTTTGYYDTEIPKVSGATVFVTNSSNEIFNFMEESEPGSYLCNNFVPQINETYALTIRYNGQTYISSEKLLAVPSITRVEQKNDGGLTGDEAEVKFYFDDLPNESNFYFLEIKNPNFSIPEYGVLEDRFFENNEMFALYISEDLKPGDLLKSKIYGVSQSYFNYMNLLLFQTGAQSGGPFTTPPATVRGNIVNQTNFDNYALGFFRLSETDSREYVFQ